MNIFVDENIPYLAGILSGHGKVITFSGRTLTSIDLEKENCQFLFTRSQTHVSEPLLKGTGVKFVATATSGIDHVDLDYLEKEKIFFRDARGSNANSVAEYVIYSVLKWAFESKTSLIGKKAGVIGFGSIGKIVAEYFYRMGLEVLISDPPLLDEDFSFPDKFQYAKLSTIAEECDIVTHHVPLTESGRYPTKYLLDEGFLSKLKPGALLINSSRGGVLDEKAFLSVSEKSGLKAATDVWENEPVFNDEMCRKSLQATPHIAGYSRDGKINGTLMMIDAFEEFTGLPVSREQMKPELEFTQIEGPAIFENHNELFARLTDSRCLHEDDTDFRKLIGKPGQVKKSGFDHLRKNYPARREILR